MSVGSIPPLLHRDRLRRVVFLCCSFARNVAFYSAGMSEHARPLMSIDHPQVAFWRQVNGNFFDMAVLDWCKLFVDRDGRQNWRKIVSKIENFESNLLVDCRVNKDEFSDIIKQFRHYRNKYLAHLDDEETIIPFLENARPFVTFYHRYIVEYEAKTGELEGLPSPDDFAKGHNQCLEEATRAYCLIR